MPRILYVEDNDDNIYMLRSRLQRQGFEVLIARDGASGVEIARSERPEEVEDNARLMAAIVPAAV